MERRVDSFAGLEDDTAGRVACPFHFMVACNKMPFVRMWSKLHLR